MNEQRGWKQALYSGLWCATGFALATVVWGYSCKRLEQQGIIDYQRAYAEKWVRGDSLITHYRDGRWEEHKLTGDGLEKIAETGRDLREIHKAMLDANNDGIITKDEFYRALPALSKE